MQTFSEGIIQYINVLRMSRTNGHTPLLGLLLCFAITTSYPVTPQPSPTALHPSGKFMRLKRCVWGEGGKDELLALPV